MDYLQSTYYIDSQSGEITEFAHSVTDGAVSDIEKAVKLYYAVRDRIMYNPYLYSNKKKDYIASATLVRGEGYCVQKAILLAALSRAAGIPARPGFANVRNHLATEKLKELMRTDIFVFHGYTEFFLEGKWIKSTPAFNLSLCEKFGIYPLEFNGKDNSIFHQCDKEGKQHMEYIHDYGTFEDFPFDRMIEEGRKYYPHLFELFEKGVDTPAGNFEEEAESDK